jgi:lipopolysaccharide export LptBFGC system permease protein LptF
LLRAEILYGPPVRLRNVTIYVLDTVGHLSEMDAAALASPLASGDQWLLRDGHYWSANSAASQRDADGTKYTVGDTSEEAEIPFTERRISLRLNTLWLANQGMSPQYLSMSDLRSLARAQINAHDNGTFRTRLQALYGEIALTCAMALLAASLSLLFFPYRLRVVTLIVTLLAGYLAHFAARAFLLMGEFAYVWPVVAGWFVPLTLFGAAGGVLWLIQKRRGPNRING